MSNLAILAAQMITCEKGLGKMLPPACARRWRIANDVEPGDCGQTRYKCVECVHGERRSKEAKVPKRKAVTSERNNGKADRCCTFCGDVYQPKVAGQKYCKRERCAKARASLHSKRAVEKREHRPLTPWPNHEEQRPAPEEVQHAHPAPTPVAAEPPPPPPPAEEPVDEQMTEREEPPMMMADDQLRALVDVAFQGTRNVIATDAAASLALKLMKKVRDGYERPDLGELPPMGDSPEEPAAETGPEPKEAQGAPETEPERVDMWDQAVEQFEREFKLLLTKSERDYLKKPTLFATPTTLWGLIMMQRSRTPTYALHNHPLTEHSYTITDDLPVIVHVRKPSQVIIRILD